MHFKLFKASVSPLVYWFQEKASDGPAALVRVWKLLHSACKCCIYFLSSAT